MRICENFVYNLLGKLSSCDWLTWAATLWNFLCFFEEMEMKEPPCGLFWVLNSKLTQNSHNSLSYLFSLVTEPTQKNLMHSCDLVGFQFLKLLLHVRVYFVFRCIIKFKPNFKDPWQTLPNVLVTELNTLHVVENFLNLFLSSIFIRFGIWR